MYATCVEKSATPKSLDIYAHHTALYITIWADLRLPIPSTSCEWKSGIIGSTGEEGEAIQLKIWETCRDHEESGTYFAHHEKI